MSQSKHRSRDQRNDYRAVVNIVTGLEGVVPLIENLRHVAQETKRQNQNGAETNKLGPHTLF